jgi:phosphomannomutase
VVVSSALSDIIGAYDIRGLVDTQLTPEVAGAIGHAWVISQQLQGQTVVIGHDMRPSSPVLADALAYQAAQAGAEVVEVGLASTDMVYYASGAWQAASVMITASHNPASYNGLKFTQPGAQGMSRHTGLGDMGRLATKLLAGEEAYQKNATPHRITRDIVDDYARYVTSLVALDGGRPLRVVVDAANGMAGLTVPRVFGVHDWPIEIIPMYFELDGTFPHHEANPLDPKNLVDLQGSVRATKADVGLAFDGDADRCFVIDENGDPVTPSAIGQMVAAREIARHQINHPGQTPTIIYNLICSRALPEKITALGAIPHRTAVGHSLIKDEMAATGAIFGAEHSAHYYFRDFWGADNGMLATLHVLAELGQSSQTLSALCADYSPYWASGEINSRVEDVPAVFDRIRREYAGSADLDDLDGLTVSGVDGGEMWWFNVRASNTEPLVRLNVEAATEETMARLRDVALGLIREVS